MENDNHKDVHEACENCGFVMKGIIMKALSCSIILIEDIIISTFNKTLFVTKHIQIYIYIYINLINCTQT